MDGRPLSVTIAGWVLTGGSVLMLLILLYTYPHRHGPDARELLPPGFHWGEMFAWPAALLVAGAGILGGQDWGRLGLMLVCAGMVGEAALLRRGWKSILICVGIAILFAFIMFGAAANIYFGKSHF